MKINKPQIGKKIKYVGLNIKFYFSLYLATIGILSVLIGIAACVINFNEAFKEWNIACKILLLFAVYLGIALLILPLFFLKRRVIYYKNGEYEVSAEYGDITKISSKHGDQKLIFINVNSTFDMIIENPGEKALVAENTNHGRFIKRVCKEKGISQEELNNQIQIMLSKRSDLKHETKDREKGNKNDYPIGTYIIYELGKISYLLFAFSRFDENNNAHPGDEAKDELPLKQLVSAINKSSQNNDVYIPLLGTGNSRYQLSNEESFNQIKHYLLSHKKQIEAKYRILIYSGIKDEVSIFKNN